MESFQWRLVALIACILSVTSAHAKSPGVAPTTVYLDRPVHFLSPAGLEVVVPRGEYDLSAESASALRLSAGDDSASIMVAARVDFHHDSVDAPEAEALRGGADAMADEILLLLTLPDGRSFAATGSFSTAGPTTRATRWMDTAIEMSDSVHFIDADGTNVILEPGMYLVTAQRDNLRLTTFGGQRSFVIRGESDRHDQTLAGSRADTLPGAEIGDANLFAVVLWLPDGTVIESIGSHNGIRPRGLLDKKPQRKAALTARLSAQVARANAVREAGKERRQERREERQDARQQKRAERQARRQTRRQEFRELMQARFGLRCDHGSHVPDSAPANSAGGGAFAARFEAATTARSDVNAYLLTYLSTLVYPDFMEELTNDHARWRNQCYIAALHHDPDTFTDQYANYTRHLFDNSARYVWFLGTGNGYDPEAMVIDSRTAVFVVFRGTDRVGTETSKLRYDSMEWIGSDFDAVLVQPPGRTNVSVHRGFWTSLQAPVAAYEPDGQPEASSLAENLIFREALAQQIVAFGGRAKPVWIVGHSLGAAQAQLFGWWLAWQHRIVPSGVYALAAPWVGNSLFVRDIDGLLPGRRLQRFEFIDDPVTMVPPPQLGYAPAGTRISYPNVRDRAVFDATERPDSILAGVAQALQTKRPLRTALETTGLYKDACYHYPQWYLAASRRQLSSAAGLPPPLQVPTTAKAYDPCDRAHVQAGNP